MQTKNNTLLKGETRIIKNIFVDFSVIIYCGASDQESLQAVVVTICNSEYFIMAIN